MKKAKNNHFIQTIVIFITSLLIYFTSISFFKNANAQPLLSPPSSPKQAQLHKLAPQLSNEGLRQAINAYKHTQKLGMLKKSILTVIDYSLPSNQKRMWIFDIAHNSLLYNTYVAHGKNSGDLFANNFSNTPQSKESSMGTYLTKETYWGGKGFSLNLQGLEKGYNNNALSRRIVMHGAWYVEQSFIKSHGRAGRSWGCPAISPELVKPIINTIKDGSVIFSYHQDSNYPSRSLFAHKA